MELLLELLILHTVTITDEQSVPTVTLTGTTVIAENAAGVATYSYLFLQRQLKLL
jgi:hypothetical protein